MNRARPFDAAKGKPSALDVEKIRRDFPILSREVHGKPLVYLDNAATSQKPRQVIDALVHYYEHYNANIHRAVHLLGEEATDAYEGARARIARFINAPSPECVIFTRNTTEAINLVAYAWGSANIEPGDEILLTELEHHSNIVPWQRLAQEMGASLKYVPVDDQQALDLVGGFAPYITERTKLVSITHISNGVGTINPIADAIMTARDVGATVLVDAAQSVPHMPVDVQALDCDFLAFSGHKMLGPTGIGVLYGKAELLQSMEPFLSGGDMIKQVTLEKTTWNDLPWKFEAGTPNVADVIALGAAVDYLQDLGLENVRAHEIELTEYALRRLRQLEDVTIYGPPNAEQRGGVISFNLPDVHPHDLGTVLDKYGVAIRTGHHCNQPLMRRLGIAGTARASFYIYNTPQEVDILLSAILEARSYFARQPRS